MASNAMTQIRQTRTSHRKWLRNKQIATTAGNRVIGKGSIVLLLAVVVASVLSSTAQATFTARHSAAGSVSGGMQSAGESPIEQHYVRWNSELDRFEKVAASSSGHQRRLIHRRHRGGQSSDGSSGHRIGHRAFETGTSPESDHAPLDFKTESDTTRMKHSNAKERDLARGKKRFGPEVKWHGKEKEREAKRRHRVPEALKQINAFELSETRGAGQGSKSLDLRDSSSMQPQSRDQGLAKSTATEPQGMTGGSSGLDLAPLSPIHLTRFGYKRRRGATSIGAGSGSESKLSGGHQLDEDKYSDGNEMITSESAPDLASTQPGRSGEPGSRMQVTPAFGLSSSSGKWHKIRG